MSLLRLNDTLIRELLLRHYNITDEDLDYLISFTVDPAVQPRDRCSLDFAACYCDNWIRRYTSNYRAYHGYVALLVCIFGTLANFLNLAVLTQRDLRAAPINRILTALAAADVLVMLEYVPFAIYEYIYLPERRTFPYGLAVFILFHMHFSQLLHTISIALTLSLAVWRYIVVRYPQRSRTWCTPIRCRMAILGSLLAAALACTPSFFVFGIKGQSIVENGRRETLYVVDSTRGQGNSLGLLYRLNFWLLGVLMKLLPCLVLTVISCRLIQELYRAKARRNLLRPSEGAIAVPQASSRTDRRADRTTRMLVAVLLLFLITEIPQGVLGLLSALLGDNFFRSCYHSLGEIMDILALINGAINFILYCSMSRQFRTTFGRLFKPNLNVGKGQQQQQPQNTGTDQNDVHTSYV